MSEKHALETARVLRSIAPFALVALVAALSVACTTTRTTTVRDVYTQGAVTSATPPQLLGTRTSEKRVRLGGSFVESVGNARTDRNLDEGAAGNAVIRRQAKGSLSVGVSERVELGFSGRYSGQTWGRDARAADADANDIPGAVGAFGIMTRVGIVNQGTMQLNLDLEAEVISLPYARHIVGNETVEYWDEELEEWVTTDSYQLEPHRVHESKLALTSYLGLSTAVRLEPVTFVGGAGLQMLPTVDGHQRVTTTCVNLECTGPEGIDEVDVNSYESVVSVYGGAEYDLGDNFSLVGIVYGGISATDSGLGAPGFAANLRLTI